MKVSAKCAMRAWDNPTSTLFEPGGVYEIERDSPLADLRTPMGRYIFEFDRNANPADKPHDYTCKRCGVGFDELSALGRHSRACKEGTPPPVDEDDEEEPFNLKKSPSPELQAKRLVCRECGEAQSSLYAMGQHKKTAHPQTVEAEP